MGEPTIAGHADQWVALVNEKVVASSASFSALVKILESQKLMRKATVTRVSGTHAIL
jgi:hypothetical protein